MLKIDCGGRPDACPWGWIETDTWLSTYLAKILFDQHHLRSITLNHLTLLLNLETPLSRYKSVCSAPIPTRLVICSSQNLLERVPECAVSIFKC
jgi:hypothetical protein